jgi:hypothetical protein
MTATRRRTWRQSLRFFTAGGQKCTGGKRLPTPPVSVVRGPNLLVLAPDIQEALLFLPQTERGRDPIHLRQLQPLAAILDWGQQRLLWRTLQARKGSDRPG